MSNAAISQSVRLTSTPAFFLVVATVGAFCTVLGLRTVLLLDARDALVLGVASDLPTSRRVAGAEVLCVGSALLGVGVGVGMGRALALARILS